MLLNVKTLVRRGAVLPLARSCACAVLRQAAPASQCHSVAAWISHATRRASEFTTGDFRSNGLVSFF